MRRLSASGFLALFCVSAAVATLNLHQLRPSLAKRQLRLIAQQSPQPVDRRQTSSPFLTENTKKFAVNGSALPLVDFDIGESYAGLLPIGEVNDTNQLFFWFFPSTNPAAEKEITIWLTGGPGCSSTGELLQSSGPFLWQSGVFKPLPNKWAWNKLTNIVYVDQPIGSGFSQGTVTATNEEDVAKQFLSFWKNFVTLFSMQGYKVYVTGSSYSGMYCPFVAAAMLDAKDTTFYNVSGMQIFDGAYNNFMIGEDIPSVAFAERYANMFGFNDTFRQSIQDTAQQCGYTSYLEKYLVFPPAGPQPTVLPSQGPDGSATAECSVFNNIFLAATDLNPCFAPYEIANSCPLVYDPLGFGNTGNGFIAAGSGPVYFNRPDVKAVIHAPNSTEWEFCNSQTPVFVNGTDNSLLNGGSLAQLGKVIDATQNVILGHGSQDFVVLSDGTLLGIQNTTFGGQLGFQQRPTAAAFVPFHPDDDITEAAGAGVFGTVHSERGLTFVGAASAGHFFIGDVPSLAFRSLEVLLGRASGFDSLEPFTTDQNATVQPTQPMGKGTVAVGFGAAGDVLGTCADVSSGSGLVGGNATQADGSISPAAAQAAPGPTTTSQGSASMPSPRLRIGVFVSLLVGFVTLMA